MQLQLIEEYTWVLWKKEKGLLNLPKNIRKQSWAVVRQIIKWGKSDLGLKEWTVIFLAKNPVKDFLGRRNNDFNWEKAREAGFSWRLKGLWDSDKWSQRGSLTQRERAYVLSRVLT